VCPGHRPSSGSPSPTTSPCQRRSPTRTDFEGSNVTLDCELSRRSPEDASPSGKERPRCQRPVRVAAHRLTFRASRLRGALSCAGHFGLRILLKIGTRNRNGPWPSLPSAIKPRDMSGSGCAERYRADVRVEDQQPTLSGTRHARAVCAPDKADRDHRVIPPGASASGPGPSRLAELDRSPRPATGLEEHSCRVHHCT